MRPSYVLGGQNMIIAHSDADIREYMQIILSHTTENAVLIDKYLMGTELEVDAICDGEDVLIPGIMEHIERAGVHSGDSIAVYPAWNVSPKQREQLIDYTAQMAKALHTKGLINVQYVIYEGGIYVIEVNPRSSRTGAVHQQGDRGADGGAGHPGDVRGEAAGAGVRHRAVPAAAVLGGEGTGIQL